MINKTLNDNDKEHAAARWRKNWKSKSYF